MRRIALLAAAVAAAAGCAGGGEGDDRLSKAEYVERAEGICEDYERRLDELGDPRNVADLARLTKEALPIARRGVASLRELAPPEDMQAAVDEWLELNDRNVAGIERLGTAARAGNEDRVQEIAREAAATEDRADRLARKLGLSKCAARG